MDEKTFKDQMSFEPRFEGGLSREEVARYDNVIVGGMGGSGLAARILFFLDQTFPVWLHDDYSLPAKSEGRVLYVAISYSGNTAETLSFAKEALAKKYSLVIITSGGALLEIARENNIPHVLVPTGFQPRNAVVYMLRALLYTLKREELLKEPSEGFVDYQKVYKEGRAIGHDFAKKIPLIYASRSNQVLAHIWKVMFNETGKIPAFDNYFPELTHNEMQGILPKTAGALGEQLKVLLLLDEEDDDRVSHEMNIFQDIASSQGINVASLELPPGSASQVIYTLIAAGGAAQVVAELGGVKADEVPFIEFFKKSL